MPPSNRLNSLASSPQREDVVVNSVVYDGSIAALLDEVCQTSDLEGLAVLDLSQEETEYVVSYSVGAGGLNTVAVGHSVLVANPGGPAYTIASDRRPIMACPWLLPPARSGGLILWRSPHGRRWTEADHGLVASLAVLLRALIGMNTGQIGIDRLTSLPNRRWFIDETDRHIDRSDLDDSVGTLILVDIDDLSQLNATLGRSAGDSVLVRLGSQLGAMIRPGDILARVGGDEFAVWQNGMDHLTAAERADALCSTRLFDDLPASHRVTFSIGIASRERGSADDVRTLLRRAHMAAREVKSQGGGAWRVSHAPVVRRGSFPEA
jgi:diguanylate cyclase (GGDEF)-like protein